MKDPQDRNARVPGSSSHQIRKPTTAPASWAAPQAVVSTLVPNVLGELAPLLWRFCRKLERKDCRADVELDEPVLPPRSPMSFWNAELRVSSVLDDKLDDRSVLLISWLLVSS
jgi:hypothetical protein